MKALLIYPEFTFWSFKHALKFIHKKAAFPPLGLLTLPPFFADLDGGVPRRAYRTTDFCHIWLTPPSLWEPADMRRYASMSIQFSRGCPFDCEFCNVTAMVGLLQAPAGTRLYERLKQEGRLLGHMSGNNNGTTNFITRIDLDTLRKGYREITLHIYSPKHYYQRVRTFLREYKTPKIDMPLNWKSVLAFFRSNIRLGIIGSERFQYWELLWWTIFKRPRYLPSAITLAVYGYHFRKVSISYSM